MILHLKDLEILSILRIHKGELHKKHIYLINTCFQLHQTEMPTSGSTHGYAYVIWDGTQQKNVIPSSTIKGIIKEGGAVQAKWRGVMYAATIVKTGSQ